MLNLHSPREITAFLNAYEIHPSKVLGQNFLIDRNMLDCIIAAADILPGRKVLEIGTGLGVLTEALLAAGAEVTTVEKDVRLHSYLRERFEGRPHCNLVFGDALALDYAALFAEGSHTHLISNLPYSVGTRVVVEASAAPLPPQHMTLLLQKEVCERFCAKENSPDRGALSVWLQQRYDVLLERDVPPSCFLPRPDVTSSIVTLRRHARHEMPYPELLHFRELVKTAFLHRRKQLASAMRGAGKFSLPADKIRALLLSVGAATDARAEALTLEQWLALAGQWNA